jgi:hypothetical protein
MDEDAFDRALQRERELREKLAAGEIGDDELEALRGFESAVTTDVRLTLGQARRLVEEGACPEAVAEVMSTFPRVPVDAAIDIVIEYDVEVDTIRALGRTGLSQELDASELVEILHNELCPDLLRLVVAVGFDANQAVAVAIELTHRLSEPDDTLESLRRAQLIGLTVDQIATIEDYEVNPRVLRRLLDGDTNLDVDSAIRLVLNDNEDEAWQSAGQSVGFVLDDVAVERSIAAVKLGATIARSVARALVGGLKNRSV